MERGRTQTDEQRERAALVLEMRSLGMTYRAIGEKLGVSRARAEQIAHTETVRRAGAAMLDAEIDAIRSIRH